MKSSGQINFVQTRVTILKSKHPRDYPDKCEAIDRISKLIDSNIISAEDLQPHIALFIEELDYSYEDFYERQTKYGDTCNGGRYRTKTYQICTILWMIGDQNAINQAVKAMSCLLSYFWARSTSTPLSTPYKYEVMLLEEMKAGKKYPSDWPKRVAEWEIQEKPERDKLEERAFGKDKSGANMHQTDSINANTKYAEAALKGAIIGATSGFLLGAILWIPACVVGATYTRVAKSGIELDFDKEAVAGKAIAGETFEIAIFICVLIGVGVQLSIARGKLQVAHKLELQLELQRQQEEERKRREAEERARRESKALERNQKSQQESLLDLRLRSHELFFFLPTIARSAAEHLDTAQREFVANAFAPFWDEIEALVNDLGEFAECIEKISQHAARYNQEAPNCPLQVPDFGVSLAVLPDIQPIVEKFALVVRKAQTDFQFSVIYEQRKTNKILVAGFASLQMAIASMGTRIDTSLRRIHRALG